MRGRRKVIVLAVGVVAMATTAFAAPLRSELSSKAEVDWSRALVVASGAAAGDNRAPSPAIARVEAERRARAVARDRLRAAAGELPLAAGGTAAAGLDDAEASARLDRALDAALDLDVDYGSDGSVRVTLALPVDAVRAALDGADAPAEAAGPAAIVVAARGRDVAPALGFTLAAGAERYRGPVIFLDHRRDLARDDRIGKAVVKARAEKLAGGVLTVDLPPARLAELARARPLVVVLRNGQP